MNKKTTNPNPHPAQFGTCPFCLSALTWNDDDIDPDDINIIIRILTCPHCGAIIEACSCPTEERESYPFYKDHS